MTPTINYPPGPATHARFGTVKTLLTWLPRGTSYAGTKRCGNWRVEVDGNRFRNIYHYSTLMLSLDSDYNIIDYSTGHGSVSDQGMMNRLFRALPNCNLYFSRAGGASIS